MIKPKGFVVGVDSFVSGQDAVLKLVDASSSKGLTKTMYLTAEIAVKGAKGDPIFFKSKVGLDQLKTGVTLTGTSNIVVSTNTQVNISVTIESRLKASEVVKVSTTITPPKGKK